MLWTAVSIIMVQTIVCGLAAVPVVTLWQMVNAAPFLPPLRIVISAVLLVPSYALFVLSLIVVSPIVNRLIALRTPDDLALPIAGLGSPVLRWVHYVASIRVVRVFAGPLLSGSPLWTAYIRWNGAHIGRRVYINTLSISDHNLLSIGDDVVIGADVHMSGHTVEAGMLKTGRVRIGDRVTIGLGSIVDIDVRIESGAQVGAMSLVPKHATLTGDTIYAGVPVAPLRPHFPAGTTEPEQTRL